MINVLVGGKDRKVVLEQERKRLEGLASEISIEGHSAGNSPQYPPSMKAPTEFSFEYNKMFATINGVKDNATYYRVHLSPHPIRNGADKNQQPVKRILDEWVRYNTKRIQDQESLNPIIVPSAAFLTKILYEVYQNAENQKFREAIDLLRNDLQKTLLNYPIWTATSFWYDQTNAKITHHTPNKTMSSLTTSAGNALFDMDRSLTGKIYRWLTDKKTGFYFDIAQDARPLFRGVSFHAFEKTFALDATSQPTEEKYALGVRIWRIEPERGDVR